MSSRISLPAESLRAFWRAGWVAALAALISCDGNPTEPPVPPEVQILSHVEGALVNEIVAPETPVVFTAQALHKGKQLPGNSISWVANGASAGVGNSSSPVVLKLGENRVCATATAIAASETLTREACITVTVRPRTLVLRDFLPKDGTVIREGEPLVCRLTVEEVPPRNSVLGPENWSLSGNGPVVCDGAGTEREIRNAISGAPPVRAVPKPGEYEISGRRCLAEFPEVCAEGKAKVTVKARPSYITYTGVFGSTEQSPRDLFRLNLETKEVERLTNRNQRWFWFELSPDGEKQVYVKFAEPCFALPYISNRDGSDETRIGWGPTWADCVIKGNTRSPRWSPDGRTIVTVGAWKPPIGPTNMLRGTLFTIDAVSREVRHINVRTCTTESSNDSYPCIAGVQLEVVWSRDGRSVFTTLEEVLSVDTMRIVVARIDVLSGAITRLWTSKLNKDPESWLPIVYDRSVEGEEILSLEMRPRIVNGGFTEAFRLAVLKADGSGEPQYITPRRSDTNRDPKWPTFCGADERVYYVDESRPTELREVQKDGTGDRVVSNTAESPFGAHGIETHRCVQAPQTLP